MLSWRASQGFAFPARDPSELGLEMLLAFYIVFQHGGDIAVKSEEGKGSRFTVRIPKGTAHIREDLRALPGMFRTRRMLWLPLLLGAGERAADDEDREKRDDPAADRLAHGVHPSRGSAPRWPGTGCGSSCR